MGVYLRTSLRAGPFRFNLSRSGIGISVGVPGFRIGTSPRGNYVRLGKSSGYFATTSARARQHGSGTEVAPPARPALPLNDPVVLQELDGVPVRQLVAASPSDVVVQIQQASRRRRLWPYAAVALASLVVLIRPVGLILLLPGVAGILWLGLRDRSRRTVVVFYEVGDEPAARFSQLVATHEQLSQAHRSWIVEARADLATAHQRKVHAGATALNRRGDAATSTSGPPVLATNIAVPGLTSKQRSVYFLPDRLLLREGKNYADLPYSGLRVEVTDQRFIEDGHVPRDARQVDTTWQYANVRGGPDRRYKNNRQLPVMLYGRLTLSNPDGFLTVWDFSRPDAASAFAAALSGMKVPSPTQPTARIAPAPPAAPHHNKSYPVHSRPRPAPRPDRARIPWRSSGIGYPPATRPPWPASPSRAASSTSDRVYPREPQHDRTGADRPETSLWIGAAPTGKAEA